MSTTPATPPNLLHTLAPWLLGLAAALAVRAALTATGADAVRADTVAAFTFIAVSLTSLAGPRALRAFRKQGADALRGRALAVTTLGVLAALLGGLGYLTHLHAFAR
jgi:hypothetical protein